MGGREHKYTCISSVKKTQEFEIRNNGTDLRRIEKSDKSSLKMV